MRSGCDGETRRRGTASSWCAVVATVTAACAISTMGLAGERTADADGDTPVGATSTVTIRLADDEEWEGAVPADVRAVLGAVVDAFLPHVPDAGEVVIEVRPRGGPISLFDRAPDGAVRVHLDTGGRLWSQYAYQFGHELCHVFCRFDRDETGNRWFEEALCELASIYVLRRMADAWREVPPYPNWRDYATSLADYAERLVDEGRLPEGMSLADWFARHRDALPAVPTDRTNARVVAVALLPLFEDDPERWAAVPWLNAASPPKPRTFRDHLADWRRHAPPAHAGAIEAIAAEFGVALPAEAPPRD